MKFSKKFSNLLEKIFNKTESYVAFELLYLIEKGAKYDNFLKIEEVDISNKTGFLKIKIGNKNSQMSIVKFLRSYLAILGNDDIKKFMNVYNKFLTGKSGEIVGQRIRVDKFIYQPLNPRSTFLSLTTKTYPHGNEDQLVNYLPKLNKDKHGNYYIILGENKTPSVMFTSHLDTADRKQTPTTLYSKKDANDDEIIFTDGRTILGSDDKSGVTVMLYMIEKQVPGLYYFFIGEEVGGIGSRSLNFEFDSIEYLKDVNKCISFDRRGNESIITGQLGRRCASDEFASALGKEYGKSNLKMGADPTGVFTDSASFMYDIPECTNISVGYDKEHTVKESQNMTFLTKLCEASAKVDWESLPVGRKIGIDTEISKKYKKLISEIKSTSFGVDIDVINVGGTYIAIDADGYDVKSLYLSISLLRKILNKYNISGDFEIDPDCIKIELK